VPEASPIRVAIVDDDPSYGRAVARLLRASKMETRIFASAEEYLSSGEEGTVDCLLLDVQLGGMSGFDLHRRLASAGSRTAVVFISGQSDESTATKAAEAGCAFVRKSDPGEIVLVAIRQAVVDALPHGADAANP
jgi:FixJ family two-component response regulator